MSIHVSVQLHTKYLFVQESHHFYNFLPNGKYFLSIHTKIIVVCGNNNTLSIDTTQQGETKMKRRGCPSGKLLLEVTSPKVGGASPKLNCL